MAGPVRLGLVGYGVGGQYFHAPFIRAADGIELAGVVTRSSERRAALAVNEPGVPVYDSLADLLTAGVDAVAVTTPPATRRELVLEALAGGVHVIADKPFAPDSATAHELAEAATRAGLLLTVFHNRRWDADVRTVKALLDSGTLGRITRFESRFDLDEPSTLDATPSGGLLRDLGSHIVDQALWLFGPAVSVTAELDWVTFPAGPVDAGFVVLLTHRSGVRSHISSTKLNHLAQRELRLYGEHGGFVSNGTDVSAKAIFAGKRPIDDPAHWGYEDESRWGYVATAEGRRPVPSARGAHQDYYTLFAAAVEGRGPLPVLLADAVNTVTVLDAARLSDASRQVVTLQQQ